LYSTAFILIPPVFFFIQHLIPYVVIKPFCKNKDVLEIGIGDGFGSYYLSKTARAVTALDFDPQTGENIKKYAEKFKTKNLTFINDNALDISLKDNSFDIVISCQVIEHMPEDKLNKYLEEIKRVLRPQGKVVITTMNVEHNIKNPKKYEKFYQHHKEFNKSCFGSLLTAHFKKVELFGLNKTAKHDLFLFMKRQGLLRYNLNGLNPVKRFYDNIMPSDYKVSRKISKSTIDLYAICAKE